MNPFKRIKLVIVLLEKCRKKHNRPHNSTNSTNSNLPISLQSLQPSTDRNFTNENIKIYWNICLRREIVYIICNAKRLFSLLQSSNSIFREIDLNILVLRRLQLQKKIYMQYLVGSIIIIIIFHSKPANCLWLCFRGIEPQCVSYCPPYLVHN